MQLQKQVAQKEDKILHQNLKLTTLDKVIANNQAKIDNNKGTMRELETKASSLEDLMAQSKQKLKSMYMKDKEEGKEEFNSEYYRIKRKVYETTSQYQQDISAKTRALDRLNTRIMVAESRKEDFERKVKDAKSKFFFDIENGKSEKEQFQLLKNELKDLKQDLINNEKVLEQTKAEITAKGLEGLKAKGELLSLEQDRESRKEDRKIRETLEDLKKYQEGYHGFFYELIHAVQSKYEMAIKVALQSALKLIVVDNFKVAQKVDEFLTEKGLYLDCLILDKIPQPKHNINKRRKQLEGKGHFIVEVVDCEKSIPGLENALKHFCGDKVSSLFKYQYLKTHFLTIYYR